MKSVSVRLKDGTTVIGDDFDMKDLIFKTPENMGLGVAA